MRYVKKSVRWIFGLVCVLMFAFAAGSQTGIAQQWPPGIPVGCNGIVEPCDDIQSCFSVGFVTWCSTVYYYWPAGGGGGGGGDGTDCVDVGLPNPDDLPWCPGG